MHASLGVSPAELSGTYFQVLTKWIALVKIHTLIIVVPGMKQQECPMPNSALITGVHPLFVEEFMFKILQEKAKTQVVLAGKSHELEKRLLFRSCEQTNPVKAARICI